MPDPFRIALASAVAGVAAALGVLLFGWPWQSPRPRWAASGWIVGLMVGVAIGAAILDALPDWPPDEDQDRLLLLVLPAVALVELAGAVGLRPTLVWFGRLAIALLTARILLHGSIYLADVPAADGAWSLAERTGILATLAAALALVWWGYLAAARRQPSRVLPVALGLCCCAAGATIMLSGYASGGQLGIVLGGAIIGGTAASWLLCGNPSLDGGIGFAAVGLFSLLVMGRYFGELSTTHAGVLLATPLLVCLPLDRWLPLRFAWTVRPVLLLLLLVPLGLVIGSAQQRFQERSGPPSVPGQSGAQDYLDFSS